MFIKNSDSDGNWTFPKQQAFGKACSLITRVITTYITFFFSFKCVGSSMKEKGYNNQNYKYGFRFFPLFNDI